MRHVIFKLGRDRYALPLETVREVIVAPHQYGRIPHAKPVMMGVMTRRGRVVPVVDLHRLLSLPDTQKIDGAGKVLLLNVARRELGLWVSDVEGISSLDRLATQTPQPQTTNSLVRGLARAGPLAITVLDFDALDAEVATSLASR